MYRPKDVIRRVSMLHRPAHAHQELWSEAKVLAIYIPMMSTKTIPLRAEATAFFPPVGTLTQPERLCRVSCKHLEVSPRMAPDYDTTPHHTTPHHTTPHHTTPNHTTPHHTTPHHTTPHHTTPHHTTPHHTTPHHTTPHHYHIACCHKTHYTIPYDTIQRIGLWGSFLRIPAVASAASPLKLRALVTPTDEVVYIQWYISGGHGWVAQAPLV